VRVFLIHGMGRSRASMFLLSSRLRRAGHDPSSFGYYVSREPLDDIVERFVGHIAEVRTRDAEGTESAPGPYAIIGHSLGNIITRRAGARLPSGLSRFIMLAPPNQPPALARAFRDNPFFRALTKDAGSKLADPDFYAALGRPDVPTLILAGDGGPKMRWLPFEGAPSDGVVGLDETRLGEVPHEVVSAVHTFIMNHAGATRRIKQFLEQDAEPGPEPPPGAGESAAVG
jgi:pimeloyl-ACP methyl ester carboxylesterase